MQKITKFNLGEISACRNELYGFSILWIMLFHAVKILKMDYTCGLDFLMPLHVSMKYGNLGCEIFLLCSGIGLYFSFMKSKEIGPYFRRRLKRLFLPVLLIEGPYWLITDVIIDHDILSFISRISMIDFWFTGRAQIWFVSLLLVLYLIYPYIHAFLFDRHPQFAFLKSLLLIGCLILLTFSLSFTASGYYDKIEIALTRIPVFIFGCMLGKIVYEKKVISALWLIPAVAVCVPLVILREPRLLTGIWYRYSYFPAGVGITFFVTYLFAFLKQRNPIRLFFSFFGKLSLNLYLSHLLVIRLYRLTPYADDAVLWHYLPLMLISIALALAAEWLLKLFDRRPIKARHG